MPKDMNNIKPLPADVAAHLSSIKAADLNLEILKDNGLDIAFAPQLLDIVSDLFHKTLPAASLPAAVSASFQLNSEISKKIACDIAGLRLYAVKAWLGEDLDKLISSWGGQPQAYAGRAALEDQAIAEEKAYMAEQLAPEPEYASAPAPVADPDQEPEPKFDPAKEKADTLETFKTDVLDMIFDPEAEEFLEDYDSVLVALLADADFRRELENSLLANQETVSEKPIVIDGQEKKPVIANWLKDFIKVKGGDEFDELDIADYLGTSPNTRPLSREEKLRLRKILKLYRNISLFPKSLEGVASDDWQIIPRDRVENPIVETGRPQAGILAKPKEKESGEYQEIEELRADLAHYQPGSLEYKAIFQEIARLEKIKK